MLPTLHSATSSPAAPRVAQVLGVRGDRDLHQAVRRRGQVGDEQHDDHAAGAQRPAGHPGGRRAPAPVRRAHGERGGEGDRRRR
jgi:hypothetical protein